MNENRATFSWNGATRAAKAVLIMVATLLTVDAARAQPVTAIECATTKECFNIALELSKQEDNLKACMYFRKAYSLSVTVGVLFKLGDCEEKLGNIASAWRYYQQVIKRLDGTPQGIESDRLRISKEKVAKLGPTVPWLTVQLLENTPRKTTVQRDGQLVDPADLGLAKPLDPGEHSIVVMAPGYHDRHYKVDVGPGQRRMLKVEPGERRGSIVPAMVSFGVAGVGFGVGAVTAAMADTRDKGLITASWAGLVTGGLAMGAGVTLLILRPGSDKAKPDDAAVHVMVGPASAQVSGAF